MWMQIRFRNVLRGGTAVALSATLALPAELPVKKVILYKHGIGYFERGGEVPAGESARLDFKANDMNDVLKSLVVQDTTGNSVAGVRYDSSQPLANKLREFPFALREKAPLADFLDQMKGAEVEIKLATGPTVQGQILGARVLTAQGATRDTETLTLLTSTGAISNYDLAALGGLQLKNPELQRQLSEYLASLNTARSREQKSVYIDSARDAARKLNVAYAIPMPVWKSSYRLVLDSGPQKKTMLEGWAIIDNTTNEDWTKVDLSVVSGRPISFISKLYEPKIIERQVAELKESEPLAPVVYKGRTANRAMGPQMEVVAAAPMLQASTAEISDVSVQTNAREAGELFEYKFSQPVTVKRNESAMLPFVQQEIQGRKLLIYTQGSAQAHPLNSVELTNSTGKALDGGPLSVYEGAIYAGESLFNTFKAGDKRLISYAEDLGTVVTERGIAEGRVLRTLTASRGIITSRFVIRHSMTYEVRNVDRKPKTLVIEHPIISKRTLESPRETEKSATHYRFEVKLSGVESQSIEVKEQELIEELQSLSTWEDEDFALVVSNSALSPAARQFFAELAALKRQLADAEAKLQDINQRIQETGKDVERLRLNLSSLNNVAGQQERVQQYASQLAALDQEISNLRTQAAAETKRRDEFRQQVQAKIEGANF
jgi:hypothetical protein